MNRLHEGSYLVYFNGIEVPASGVSVQYGVGGPSQASISVAPDRELIRLGEEDRVHVLIFYLDDIFTRQRGKKPDYRLLFEGEISGWSYSTNAAGRAISFSAVGLSQVLQLIHPNLMTNTQQVAGGATGGATQANFVSPLYPSQVLYIGMDPKNPQLVKRPFDLVENTFASLFGLQAYSTLNKHFSSSGVHFFARWARKWNYINRWAPSPYIEGADLALANDGVFPVLQGLRNDTSLNALKAMAEQQTFSSMGEFLTTLMGQMYYEYTDLPNMPAVTYDLVNGKIQGPPEFKQTANNLEGKGPADNLKPIRLLQHITKPQLHFCAVPRCNIIFPSMIEAYQYAEGYTGQITRLYTVDPGLASYTGADTNSLALRALKTGFPYQVKQFLNGAKLSALLSDKNFLVFPEEYFRGPVIQEAELPRWFIHLANATLTAVKEAAKEATSLQADLNAAIERLSAMYDVYAKYEYYKNRSSQKSGAVTTRFNPYVVPGFPAVIIDNPETNVHVFCYVMSVSHSLSPQGMQTTISYSFAQTFDQFFETYVNEVSGAGGSQLPQVLYNEAKAALDSYDAAFMEKYRHLYEVAMPGEATIMKDGKPVDAVIYARQQLLRERESFQGERAALLDRMSLAAAEIAPAAYKQVEAARKAYDDILAKAESTSQERSVAEKALKDAEAAFADAVASTPVPDMVPASPVMAVQRRFQVFANAEQYYNAIFRQYQSDGRSEVFNWKTMLGALQNDGRVERLNTTITTTETKVTPKPTEDTATPKAVTVTKRSATTNSIRFGPNGYALMPEYAALGRESDLAMDYIARPIVTLDEYIDFSGNRGVKQEAVNTGAAPYYVKILDLKQGPGADPGYDEASGNPKALVLTDTRRNWEDRLLNYRLKMRSMKVFTS